MLQGLQRLPNSGVVAESRNWATVSANSVSAGRHSLDQFEEYTRRQYLAKKPEANPFGEEEQATKFDDLSVLTRVRTAISAQASTRELTSDSRLKSYINYHYGR